MVAAKCHGEGQPIQTGSRSFLNEPWKEDWGLEEDPALTSDLLGTLVPEFLLFYLGFFFPSL